MVLPGFLFWNQLLSIGIRTSLPLLLSSIAPSSLCFLFFSMFLYSSQFCERTLQNECEPLPKWMSSVLSQDATFSRLHIPPCMSLLLILSPLTKISPLLLFSPPTKLQHRCLPKSFFCRPPFSCQQTITWKLQLNTSMWIMAHQLLKGHVNNPYLQSP